MIRNVQLINITGDARNAGIMYGLPDSPIRDVKFENCKISAQKGLVVQNVKDVDFSGLDLTVKQGEPIIFKDAKPQETKQPAAPVAAQGAGKQIECKLQIQQIVISLT